jgi:hypothetical protein
MLHQINTMEGSQCEILRVLFYLNPQVIHIAAKKGDRAMSDTSRSQYSLQSYIEPYIVYHVFIVILVENSSFFGVVFFFAFETGGKGSFFGVLPRTGLVLIGE